MTWDGKDRRSVNQDSVERDRLLTEVATNVKFLVDSQKNITMALVDHAKVDDTRFGNIDKTLKEMSTTNAIFYGKVWGGSAVASGIAAVLIKLFVK